MNFLVIVNSMNYKVKVFRWNFTFQLNLVDRQISDKKRHAFYESQIGKNATVLFEADSKDGLMHGFTRNYVKVSTKFDPILVNELKAIQLTGFDAFGDVSIIETNVEELSHHSMH